MESIKVIYKGNLQTQAIHLRSGTVLFTEAPVDNEGTGMGFSPTDLLATALGSCIMTIIGISAKKHNFNVDGASVNITKIMAESPRKVSEIVLEFDFSGMHLGDKEKTLISHAIKNCPVALSIHPEIKISTSIHY